MMVVDPLPRQDLATMVVAASASACAVCGHRQRTTAVVTARQCIYSRSPGIYQLISPMRKEDHIKVDGLVCSIKGNP